MVSTYSIRFYAAKANLSVLCVEAKGRPWIGLASVILEALRFICKDFWLFKK
ncbi:hypothetical protein TorRG33x02_138150 [Trema orientale]|uniref:Uncharacterized protein n=1 Tax=Trema orientale TaxID=63057 RepID=A0A2P5EXT2_TREOI|nr:hypothetical protein TorRG33x02_138150 [Trema orientale]